MFASLPAGAETSRDRIASEIVGQSEAPQRPWERASMTLDLLDPEDELPWQAGNGVPFGGQPGEGGASENQAPGSGASDLLDAEDDSPGCVDGGTSGPRVRWLYVVPSDRTNYFAQNTASGKTREVEMRENVKFADRLLAYGTGPWRDQYIRWYCSGTTPVITPVVLSVAVGSDNKISESEIVNGLSGFADGDLHPLWLNLGPDDCLASNGVCLPDKDQFVLDYGPTAALSTEINHCFAGRSSLATLRQPRPTNMLQYTNCSIALAPQMSMTNRITQRKTATTS